MHVVAKFKKSKLGKIFRQTTFYFIQNSEQNGFFCDKKVKIKIFK
jgi:hypothetical protein